MYIYIYICRFKHLADDGELIWSTGQPQQQAAASRCSFALRWAAPSKTGKAGRRDDVAKAISVVFLLPLLTATVQESRCQPPWLRAVDVRVTEASEGHHPRCYPGFLGLPGPGFLDPGPAVTPRLSGACVMWAKSAVVESSLALARRRRLSRCRGAYPRVIAGLSLSRSVYYCIFKYLYHIYMVQACNPPSPPAMVMVPRVGCTISLESNYHARYLCFPAPPCGVGWV